VRLGDRHAVERCGKLHGGVVRIGGLLSGGGRTRGSVEVMCTDIGTTDAREGTGIRWVRPAVYLLAPGTNRDVCACLFSAGCVRTLHAFYCDLACLGMKSSTSYPRDRSRSDRLTRS
jgi:hypothetical protein